MTKPDLYGLILAGGRSTRMGADKSALVYHGVPQRDYLHALLQKFCVQVFTSCKHDQGIPAALNPLPDREESPNPMHGVLAAIHQHADVAWLTVPVDMPNVNDVLLHYLIEHRTPEKFATCFFDSTGKSSEPLLTIWEPRGYISLKEYAARGGSSLRAFLQAYPVALLTVPDPNYLLNINTPDSYDRYRNSG
jgi:molybdenum cofactor guanylyltransferase